ncbi:hypothetical protein [Microbacterium sp. NPDC087592]|uniref:hypothetical protein n=1 Tax=Microbacterium sp. NPDC087592 TaxID=3364193 RepID=UPI00381C513B
MSLVAKDDRGFTHIYEEVETTPAAVRDAFDLMARHAPRAESSEGPSADPQPDFGADHAKVTSIETEAPGHRSNIAGSAGSRNRARFKLSS